MENQVTLCKDCKIPLILDNAHFICPYCAKVSHQEMIDTLEGIPFKQRDSYFGKSVDLLTKRITVVNAIVSGKLNRICELNQLPDASQQNILTLVGQIIERCVFSKTSLPRSNGVFATAVLIVAVTHMRLFEGSISPTVLMLDDDKEKDFHTKVERLVEKIENCPQINIFGQGYLQRVSAVKKLEACFVRACNQLEIPYQWTCKMLDKYKTVKDEVLLNGKNSSYVIGAVIAHSFHCPHVGILTQPDKDLLDSICITLNLKKKILIDCVTQLKKACCNEPKTGTEPTSRSKKRIRKD